MTIAARPLTPEELKRQIRLHLSRTMTDVTPADIPDYRAIEQANDRLWSRIGETFRDTIEHTPPVNAQGITTTAVSIDSAEVIKAAAALLGQFAAFRMTPDGIQYRLNGDVADPDAWEHLGNRALKWLAGLCNCRVSTVRFIALDQSALADGLTDNADLLTAPEVATLTGEPINNVRRWGMRQDRPHGVRIDRQIRYRRSEVEAWIARQQENGED